MMNKALGRLWKRDKSKNVSLSDSYLAKMLWRFLRPYRWQLVCVFVILLAVSGLSLLLPFIIQQAIDGPITAGNLDALVPFGVVYILAVIGEFSLRFGYIYWLQTIGQNALLNLRQTLFEHIMEQDMQYFNRTAVGKIVSRMSNDIEALTDLLSTSIVIVMANMVTLIGIIIAMFLLNWRLALVSLVMMPIMVGVSGYFRVKIRALASRFHSIMADYQGYLNEQFNGMLIVQLFNRQQRSRDDFGKINDEYFDTHMGLRDTYTIYGSLLHVMTTTGLAIVLYGGGSGVLAGWASIGMLIAFIEYTRRSYEPILQLSEQFAQIQTALSAGERIAKMLQVTPHVTEADQPKRIINFDQSVNFDHVKFGYKPNHPVLHDIDMTIKPGERVAIVGATGAGKTSLVKLLARYYDVNDGAIKVSGVDIRDLKISDLRRYVTVVPQNPYCFNGTIADNLRLFDPDVSYEQMVDAAKLACAHQFIERLPDQYDFELLPGGANLSQGQRQLLALARALIHSPESILVLDEATSNIDTETEELIQQGLEQIFKNRTSIIIAHRLSTIRDADRIWVMRSGHVVEEGNHDKLLSLDGVYAQLYRRQFADETAAAD